MADAAEEAVWADGGGAAIIETSLLGVAPELEKNAAGLKYFVTRNF
jgi:hypothetical protein